MLFIVEVESSHNPPIMFSNLLENGLKKARFDDETSRKDSSLLEIGGEINNFARAEDLGESRVSAGEKFSFAQFARLSFFFARRQI